MVRSPDGTINIKIVLKPQIIIRPEQQRATPAPVFVPEPAPAFGPPAPELAPAPVAGQSEEAAVGAALAQIAQALGAPPSAPVASSAGPCAAIANVLYTVPTPDHNELAILREACAAAGLDCSVLNSCSNDAVVGVLGTLLTTITEQTPNCRDILRDALNTLACAPAPSVVSVAAPTPVAAPSPAPAPVVNPEAPIEQSDAPAVPAVIMDALKQVVKKKEASDVKRIYADHLLNAQTLVSLSCEGVRGDDVRDRIARDAVNKLWDNVIDEKKLNPSLKLMEIPPSLWDKLLTDMRVYISSECKKAGGKG